MQFLQTVCPSAGHKAFIVANGGYMRHLWTPAHTLEQQAALDQVGNQVYFALAGYETDGPRKIENAKCVRSFWLDIDAGPKKFAKHGDKVYETQAKAIGAVNLFSGQIGIDPTYIVSSGQGIHVYWSMDADIDAQQWRDLAFWFKHVVSAYGLKQDPARTADITSILRPVGTMHSCGEPVEILFGSEQQTPLSEWIAMLEASGVPQPTLKQHTPGEKQVFTDTKFANLANKALEGGGCEQLAALLRCGGNVEEPLWRAGLSVAQACDDTPEDKELNLIALSKGHPEFNLTATLDKAESTVGPYSCESFASLNPAGCQGCKFRGTQITNPIMFAKSNVVSRMERLTALAASGPAEAPSVMGTPVQAPTASTIPQGDVTPLQPALPAHQVPDRHEHFQDPRNGVMFTAGNFEYRIGKWLVDTAGVVRQRKDTTCAGVGVTVIETIRVKNKETGEWDTHLEAKVLLGVSLYIFDRIDDRGERTNNERYYTRVEYPHDPIRDFTLEASTISKGGDTMKTELARVGAIPDNVGAYAGIQQYLMGWSNYLREQRSAKRAPVNMGWTPTDSIVYGDTEYTALGPVPAPISDSTSKFFAGSKALGNVEGWRTAIAAMYPNDQAGVQAYQFMVLTGLAAPMYAKAVPDHEVGGVISFFAAHSGGGKTTAQRMALSVYGDPSAFHVAPNSTMLAKIQIMGMANSFPTYIDEITTANARALTDFVYNATQGKGKDRMTDGGASLMDNNTSWRSFTLTSANLSLVETLQGTWGASDGTPMRVLEIEAPRIRRTATNGDALERSVQANRGCVGAEWLQTLVRNPATAAARVYDMKLRLQREVTLEASARFRLNMMAAVLAAGEYASELDMHPFDMSALFAWGVNQLRSMTTQAAENLSTPESQFADFMQEVQRNVLWVKKGDTVPDFDLPNQDIIARAEVEHSILMVSCKALQHWCREQQCSYGAITQMLKLDGAVKARRRLMAGTTRGLSTGPVHVWEIDLIKSRVTAPPNPEPSNETKGPV